MPGQKRAHPLTELNRKSCMTAGTTALIVDAVLTAIAAAAINLKNRAVGHPVLKAHRVSVRVASPSGEAIAGFGEKPTP